MPCVLYFQYFKHFCSTTVTSFGNVEPEAVHEEELQKLQQFDLDWRFGPCTGNKLTSFT